MLRKVIVPLILLFSHFLLVLSQTSSISPVPTTLNNRDYAISYQLDFDDVGGYPLNNRCAYYKNGQCAFCTTGFQLNAQNDCEEIFQRCKLYSQFNYCSQCHQYFDLVDGSCIDPRCSHSGFYICQQCKTGYMRTLGGFCIDMHCVTYDQGKCKTCEDRYTLSRSDDKCIEQNEGQQPTNTTNPNLRNETEKNAGITIQVAIEQFETPGCLAYNGQIECIKCKQNYKLSGVLCIEKDNPCAQFDQLNGKCLACNVQFQLKDGLCYFKRPLNCIRISNRGCVQCRYRYFLKEGTCLQVSPQCKDYNKVTGACFTCFYGYVLKDGECKRLNSENQTSVFTSELLPIPNKTKQMLQLLKNYCLEFDNSGEQCLKCYSSYFPINGVCQRVNHLCKTYNQTSGICLTCLNGYTIENGRCVPDESQSSSLYCAKMRDQDSCETCQSGYFLYQNSICITVNPSCYQYSKIDGRCSACYKGFFLNEGYCRVIPIRIAIPFCKRYNPVDPRQCLSCVSGFYLQDNLCRSLKQVCVEFRRDNGLCLNCRQNYILQSGSCVQDNEMQVLSPNCEEYNEVGLCTKCEQNFVLFNYICRRQDI